MQSNGRTDSPADSKLSILLSLVMNTLAKSLQRWEKDGSMGKAQKEAEVHRRKSEDALANVEAQSEATEGFDDGERSPGPSSLGAGLDEQTTVLNTAALTFKLTRVVELLVAALKTTKSLAIILSCCSSGDDARTVAW